MLAESVEILFGDQNSRLHGYWSALFLALTVCSC